jgi:hypothetical protein
MITVLETVAVYYDAWESKRGDFSEVPLADDFEFIGPVASFDTAEGYRAMAAEAGQAVTSFAVRRQFVDGSTVCSIIDWEMAMPGIGRLIESVWLEPTRTSCSKALFPRHVLGSTGLPPRDSSSSD